LTQNEYRSMQLNKDSCPDHANLFRVY